VDTNDRGLLLYFFEKFNGEEVMEALTVAWMIWLRRNSVMFGKGFLLLSRSFQFSNVKIYLESWSQASSSSAQTNIGLEVSHSTWNKPSARWWKINWDATIDKECDDFFIYLFFLKKIQTDLHSGTTTCRSANIWQLPHNM
jgi:hypothetical protein